MGTAISDNSVEAAHRDSAEAGAATALYDGRCRLCHRMLRFATRRARPGKLQFLTLQSEAGQELLRRHGIDPQQRDSMILIEGGKAFMRSDASLHLLRHLHRPWPILSAALIVPRPIRDWIYDWIARHRTHWFGTCELPANDVHAL
jgi:predicted DCC family thiol-disulfide oxidoreductase YuxK